MKKIGRFLGKVFQKAKNKIVNTTVPDQILDGDEVNLKNDGVLFTFIVEKITSRGIILVALVYGIDYLFTLGLFV